MIFNVGGKENVGVIHRMEALESKLFSHVRAEIWKYTNCMLLIFSILDSFWRK